MIFLNIIESGFAKLGIWIITGIYHVIALIFQLFLILSTGTIIEPSTYQVLLSNIYVLLGVFLLFFVAFAFLKGMIDADDKKTTESTKKTIINFITSFVMIALLPTVFAFLFDLQTSIITRQNTIGKLFGYGSSSEGTNTVSVPDEIKVGSYQMVNGVMNAFLYVNPDENGDISSCTNVQTSSDLHNCEANVCSSDKAMFVNFDASDPCGDDKHSFNNTIAYVNQTGKFSSYRIFGEEIADGKVEFNFILALIGGIIVGYVAFSFCFDMALRMVKLAYYQIIAPIPIFMRIMPNSNMSGTFNTWTKKTLSCYFEVFIRVLVFYFAIFLVNAMMDSSLMANITDMAGWFMALLAKAFIIMGIVMFMKQAPKLISEITGIDSGSMKLGVKDKLKEGGFFAAANAVGGLVGSKGNPLAAYRGLKYGSKNADFKGIGTEVQRRQRYEDAMAGEKDRAGRNRVRRAMAADYLREKIGLPSSAEAEERRIRHGSETVTNRSGSGIEVKDDNGNVIWSMNSQGQAEINDTVVQQLENQKTRNVGTMSANNDRIRELDKLTKWSDSQRAWKSAMDDEADKKFNDGKFEYSVRYMDPDGNIKTEKINGKRFAEMSQKGYKFLANDGNVQVSYTDANGETITKKVNQAELSRLQSDSSITNLQTSEIQLTEKKVKDAMREAFSTSELASQDPNLIKKKTESFFTTLQNEGGFGYQSFLYDDKGQKILNADGTAAIQKGTFTTEYDAQTQTRTITHINTEPDGTETKRVYTVVGNGMLEYEENGVVKTRSIYDLSDDFDKKSKSTSAVLEAEKQHIEEVDNKRAREENEAIDNVIKQYKEQVEEKLRSDAQQQREKAKTYRSKNGK